MFDEKYIDQQILAICEKLLERALNCKIEDSVVHFSSDRVHEEQLFLLSTLPWILIIALSSIAGHKKYQKLLKSIKELLDKETDYKEIYNELAELFSCAGIPNTGIDKSIENSPLSEAKIYKILGLEHTNDFNEQEMPQHSPPGIEILNILISPSASQLHSSSIYYKKLTIFNALVFSLGNYFVLAFMIYATVASNKKCHHLTSKEIAVLNFACDKVIGEINVYNIYFYLMTFIAKDTISRLKIKKNSYNYKRTIPFPRGPKLFFHEYEGGKESFYTIDQSPTSRNKFKFSDDNSLGLAVNTNVFNSVDFKLIVIVTINDNVHPSDKKKLKGTYFLIETNPTNDNHLLTSTNQLYQMVNECSSVISTIMESWKNFIDQPSSSISSNFDNFEEWLTSVLCKSYGTRDELLKSISLSRMLGSIDTEIAGEGVVKTRELYKEAKKHHIPLEKREIFNKIFDEVGAFVGAINFYFEKQGNSYLLDKETVDKKEILEYFDQHKKKYNYLSLLDHSVIKRLDFELDPGSNAIRDDEELIAFELNNKWGWQYFSKSRLYKLLGKRKEKKKEKYMRWSE